MPLCPALRGDVDVSAVCQYHIREVKNVFEGPYKEYREASQKWERYKGSVPNPRPGAVSANATERTKKHDVRILINIKKNVTQYLEPKAKLKTHV